MYFTAKSQEAHYQCIQYKQQGLSIGFVPTMGALHKGHLSLIERAKQENDIVVCSIFVNPIQFNNQDDLARYPRTLEADRLLLEQVGCHLLFAPSEADMYPRPPRTRLSFGELEHTMEGKYRPGHFHGVGLVVSRLFHIVQPDRAYFGQKDYQQYLIVRQLVEDLLFPVQIVLCSTVREPDGLAMSSRNRRLNPQQRQQASLLYQSLKEAQRQLLQTRNVDQVKKYVNQYLAGSGIQLEYFEVADAHTLMPAQNIDDHQQIVLCIAAYVGDVRLIDNVLLFS